MNLNRRKLLFSFAAMAVSVKSLPADIFGDANCDGMVNAQDLTATANVLVGNGVPPTTVPRTAPKGQIISDVYDDGAGGILVVAREINFRATRPGNVFELTASEFDVSATTHPYGEFVELVAGVNLPMEFGSSAGWTFSVFNGIGYFAGPDAKRTLCYPGDFVTWRRV